VIYAVVIFFVMLTAVLVLLLCAMREFKNAAKDAESRSRMKSEFLATMSHELRAPMNGIIGFSELALNCGLPGDARRYLGKIQTCSEGLMSIINDILDIAKIESGKIELERIPFTIAELFAYCETAVSLSARQKGIALSFADAPDARFVGDPTKLRQILLNLLSNAVKFTDSGAVEVSARVIDQMRDSLRVCFEVRDSGIGISVEQMQKIFQPFEQADMSVARRYGGTGLGLTIAKNLAELMDGELDVESAPGKGSLFRFALDIDLAQSRAEQKIADSQASASASFAKPVFSATALVCEDNEINQEVIQELLWNVGIETVIAPNGSAGVAEAMRRVNSHEPLDLIFMDMFMPVMDGIEAAKELRRRGCFAPIIALTAGITMNGDVYEACDIAYLLNKPFTARELWDCLLKYLKPVSMETPVYPAGNEAPPR
jgi:CheY-like chemotaxis protein